MQCSKCQKEIKLEEGESYYLQNDKTYCYNCLVKLNVDDIDLTSLVKQVTGLEDLEVEEFAEKGLPAVIELVLKVGPNLKDDFTEDYTLIRDKIYNLDRTEFVDIVKQYAPSIISSSVNIINNLENENFEELNEKAPLLVDLVKNHLNPDTAKFVYKMNEMVSKLDVDQVTQLIAPNVPALIYLDKALDGYTGENLPRAKKFVDDIKSKKIKFQDVAGDVLRKGEEGIMLVGSTSSNMSAFSNITSSIPEALGIVMSLIGRKGFLKVEGLDEVGIDITGAVPGPVDFIDFDKHYVTEKGPDGKEIQVEKKLSRGEHPGVWGNLETDAVLKIAQGGKGLARLIYPLANGELINLINQEKWVQMFEEGFNGWPPSDKLMKTALQVGEALTPIVERNEFNRIINSFVYPIVDSIFRKYKC